MFDGKYIYGFECFQVDVVFFVVIYLIGIQVIYEVGGIFGVVQVEFCIVVKGGQVYSGIQCIVDQDGVEVVEVCRNYYYSVFMEEFVDGFDMFVYY